MNTKTLLDHIDKDFIHQYLTAYSVHDIKRFIKPNMTCFDNFARYPNVRECAAELHRHIIKGKKIGILVDCDHDGYCSAAIVAHYLTKCGIKPTIFHHYGKAHGLHKNEDEDIVQQVLDSKVKLLIVPDAGSNDVDECRALHKHGVSVIIMDHHEINVDNPYAIVVNHHLGNELNTTLSGTGVAFKCIQEYQQMYETPDKMKYIKRYYAFVALSIISDMCDASVLENRAFIVGGLKQLHTIAILDYLAQKLNRRGMVPEGFSFGLISYINALCRSHDQEGKAAVFNSIVSGRGKDKALDILKQAKVSQQTIVDKLWAELESTLDVINHKVIIGYIDKQYKEYTGLIANKIMRQYGKPCIILRQNNDTMYSGSLRSPRDIAGEINMTGIAYCEGHLSACGIVVHQDKVDVLIEWFDGCELFNTDPPIEVVADIEPIEITLNLCEQIVDNMDMFSTGLPIPLFHVHATIDQSNIAIFKKRSNTIRITIDGVPFLKFMATNQLVEDIAAHEQLEVDMIVRLDVNEYLDNRTPQAKIEQLEFVPVDTNKPVEIQWDELFG